MIPELTSTTHPAAARPLLGWTRRLAVAAIGTAYVLALAGTNVLTSTVGMVPAGFGLTVTAGTYTAGLALALRDTLHDLAGARIVLLALAVAATVSALTADPRIVVASTVAAVVAELADFAVYTPLRHRSRPLAVAASGLIGALVDSVGFLELAGFPLTAPAIAGQVLVKAVWVTAAYLLLTEGVRRVVPRQRQHPAIRAAMRAGDLGMIITPAEGRPPQDGVVFGADNGCFGRGYPGDARWLAWLAKWAPHADRCLWATAPDVVGDARATLARSRPLLPRIRALGLQAALVAQEGAEQLRLPWDEFDVLFLGGQTTTWKLGPAAAELIGQAHRHGKSVHMGRVNSQKRWRYAHSLGCASVDGTCLTFAPDLNLERVRRWITTTPIPAPASHLRTARRPD